MPKTNDNTGATYAGYEGVVEHAGGPGSTRPGGLSELDPSRNLDGSVVDNFESDERELDDRDGPLSVVGEVRPVEQPTTAEPLADRDESGEASGGESSSAGDSSSASSKSSASTSAKSARNPR